MKKFFAFLAAAAMLVGFSACGGDDDGGGDGDNGRKNQVTIGSKTYELKDAKCWWYTYDNGITEFDIYFYDESNSDGHVYDKTGGSTTDDYDGGAINTYYFYCDSTTPKSGTYTINGSKGNMTFRGWIEYSEHYDTGDWYDGNATSAVINNLGGGIYEIIISGKASDGTTPIDLYYKGTMPFFESI